MAEAIQKTSQEFWQPPSPLIAANLVVPEALPVMAEACPSCGTEFLVGSRFCHSCGRRRPEGLRSDDKATAAEMAGLWKDAVMWSRALLTGFSFPRTWNRIKASGWLHYLSFHEIQQWVGLPTGSLIAFIVGLACVAGALLVGLLTARNFTEWQAIQFYRAEWLLGATAAFVAGILLKRSSNSNNE